MNREAEKTARTETGAGPVVVDMRGRVPLLDDKALAVLHANAVRLKDSTNTRQRASVAELLPVIEAELKSRQDLKRATAAAKAPRTTKKKVKTAAAAEE